MRHRDTFTRRRISAIDLITGEVVTPTAEEPVPAPRNALVLVRMHDHPLGTIEVDDVPNGIPPIERVRELAWQRIRNRIIEHLSEDGLAIPDAHESLGAVTGSETCSLWLDVPPTSQPIITVAIATMSNAAACIACVERVLASSYTAIEVVVVDNAPEDGSTRSMVDQHFGDDKRVRYAAEHKRGLSRVRNKGAKVASGEIVVFIDDDVIVDHHWLNAIAHTFTSNPDVACVTGSIIAAELETPAQSMLEQFGGFNKGSLRKVFDLGEHRRPSPLYPFDAGRFGSGANMAFRASALKEIGGFCETLGAGTPAHGGEDIDIMRRTVSSGRVLVYEPAALMWHSHRRSYTALEKQMFRYGVGLSATVMKWLLEDRCTAVAVVSRLPAGLRHVISPSSDKNRRKHSDYPRLLTWLELLGIAVGPFAYLKSRARR